MSARQEGLRRICVVLTTRGNYAKLASTLAAVRVDKKLLAQIALGGPLVEADNSDFALLLKRTGHQVDRAVAYLVKGAGNLDTMTQSAARAVQAFGETFAELKPDIVVIVGDRYEALSAAFAATCQNVVIAHVEGGESSGSIDERLRHAITKLAHIHFPANELAAERIRTLGEDPDRIFVVGSPSLDLLAGLDLGDRTSLFDFQANNGEGDPIEFDKPYIAVSQHPVVNEHEMAAEQIRLTAAAVADIGMPTVWVLPNRDAGSDAVDETVSQLQQMRKTQPMRCFRSLPMPIYAALLHNAACLVGNSSSGIRECAFLGVPVVNIGTRQSDRLRGSNVIDVGHGRDEIVAAIGRQLGHGRYAADTVYGDGRAGEKIAHALATVTLDVHKRFFDVSTSKPVIG